MKLKTRFSILAFLIVLFAVIAPAIVYYALGYRWDNEQHKFVATGTLLVASLPKNAQIYLNDKQARQSTPATLRLLVSGEYEVTIKKEGYEPWQQRITIFEKQVSTARPENRPVALYLENRTPVLSATSTILVKFNNNQPDLVNNVNLPQDALNPDLKMLSSGENLALIKKGNNYWILDLKNRQTYKLPAFASAPENLEEFGATSVLLHLQNGNLENFNFTNSSVTLLKRQIQELVETKEYIYTIEGRNLIRYNKDFKDATPLIEKLPDFSIFKLFESETGRIFILLDNNLYYYGQDKLSLTATGVENGLWSRDSNAFVYYSQNALWLYNVKAGTHELVTRTSDPITAAVYAIETSQIIYASGIGIHSIESESGTNRASTRLIEAHAGVTSLYLSREGDMLYYLTRDNNFYTLQIQ